MKPIIQKRRCRFSADDCRARAALRGFYVAQNRKPRQPMPARVQL